MACAFHERSPVLDFGATWKPGRYREPLLTLLWPAFEYQVVVPVPRERRINVLQKHIIGLTLCGIRSAEKISEYLALELDLVKIISRELQETGLLDSGFALTPAGRAVLDEERAYEQPKMTVGRVYQDPWTGKPWPRFLSEERATRINAKFLAEGRVQLIQGTVGSTKIREALVVRPESNPHRPELKPRDVLQAFLEHRKAIDERGAGRSSREAEGVEDLEADDWVERIAQVGHEPTAVWLTTYAFVPQDVEHGALWMACDPFGLGVSLEMREQLDRRRAHDRGLRAEIARISGRPAEECYMTYSEMLALIHGEATVRVEDELTIAIRNYERIFEAAIRMESNLIEADRATGDVRTLKLQEVVTRAQVVIEQAFEALRTIHKTDRCYDGQGLVHNDVEHNADMFRQMAGKVGFHRPPDSVVRVRLGKIMRAANSGEESVNPRFLAALLVAHREPRHPLWKAARTFPDMLSHIAEVSELRNKAGGAGAGTGEFSLDMERVRQTVRTVYRIIRALLPDTGEYQV